MGVGRLVFPLNEGEYALIKEKEGAKMDPKTSFRDNKRT